MRVWAPDVIYHVSVAEASGPVLARRETRKTPGTYPDGPSAFQGNLGWHSDAVRDYWTDPNETVALSSTDPRFDYELRIEAKPAGGDDPCQVRVTASVVQLDGKRVRRSQQLHQQLAIVSCGE